MIKLQTADDSIVQEVLCYAARDQWSRGGHRVTEGSTGAGAVGQKSL